MGINAGGRGGGLDENPLFVAVDGKANGFAGGKFEEEKGSEGIAATEGG